MHQFCECNVRKQVPHLQHHVTEPWPQSMFKYKTFQVRTKNAPYYATKTTYN